MHSQIKELLESGVISRVNHSYPSVVCSPLLVPKGEGFRLCVNYKPLDLLTKKSRLQNIPNMWEGARKLAREGSWFRKIDLKAAYWRIPLTETARKATCFFVGKEFYAWNGMPFGPSEAPSFFNTAIANWLISTRLTGVVQYFDDFICFGSTPEACNKVADSLISEIDRIGFIVNEEKSSWTPSEEIVFCGYGVRKNEIFIPDSTINGWKNKPPTKDIRKVRGTLSRWSWFIKNKKLFRSSNLQFSDLPRVVTKEIKVEREGEKLTLFTDASDIKQGTCGLVVKNQEGKSLLEKSWLLPHNWRSPAIPIWEKELRALRDALEWLPVGLREKLTEVMIDNRVALAKVKNWRAERKPLTPQEHMVATVKKSLKNIIPEFVKSEENPADRPSRNERLSESRNVYSTLF